MSHFMRSANSSCEVNICHTMIQQFRNGCFKIQHQVVQSSINIILSILQNITRNKQKVEQNNFIQIFKDASMSSKPLSFRDKGRAKQRKTKIRNQRISDKRYHLSKNLRGAEIKKGTKTMVWWNNQVDSTKLFISSDKFDVVEEPLRCKWWSWKHLQIC